MFVKRSLSLSGHKTSLALEPEFWAVVDAACRRDGVAMAALIRQIDEARVASGLDQPLSSAVRVWALTRVQAGEV